MLCINFIIRMRAPIQFIDFSVSNLYKSNGDIMLLRVRVRGPDINSIFFLSSTMFHYASIVCVIVFVIILKHVAGYLLHMLHNTSSSSSSSVLHHTLE